MKQSNMNQLLYRFSEFTRDEVLQEIRLAEMEAAERGPRLAFTAAWRNLQDMRRTRLARMLRFPNLTDEDLAVETSIDTFIDEMEWADFVRQMPLPARKLAEIAKREAESFENVPNGVWEKSSLVELRRRVKRSYIAWDRNHCEQSYLRARSVLVNALRAHAGKKAFIKPHHYNRKGCLRCEGAEICKRCSG